MLQEGRRPCKPTQAKENHSRKNAQRALPSSRRPTMAISPKVNGATRSVDAEPDTPLLYVLRNDLELNGAKYGCGLTQCGACTVLVNGAARRSCVTPVGSIEGNEVTTLEGLGTLDKPHPQPDHSRRPARRATEREDLTMDAPRLTRRNFTAALGGIVLSFSLVPRVVLGQDPARLPGSLQTNRTLDAWLRINADGSVTVFTGKVELGQGIVTALAQIAAEELEVPLARVTMISGDTGRTPNEGQTAGSQSIEQSGTALRMAGAEVRALLIGLAARKLGVSADTLKVTDGVIHAPDGRTVGYGELTAEADLKREATAKVPPKPAAQYKIVGKSAPRIDIPAKMTGGAAFVQDLRLPGMVHGRAVRPPRYGARLQSFDEAKVKAMPGVIAVVRDGSFLGVVARREEQAINARLVLIESAKWSGGSELPDPTKMYEQLMSLRSEDRVIGEKDAPVPADAKVIEATYHRPYQAHAAIAPSCALAELKDGKLTVWTHSQGVFPLRATIARALGLQPRDIRCIHAEGPGCYGHNGADDAAFDAAMLARAVNGRPVRLQWMRDDEFKWEPYGPAMTMKVKGAVAGGRVVDWTFDVWSQG